MGMPTATIIGLIALGVVVIAAVAIVVPKLVYHFMKGNRSGVVLPRG
jgi:hypothetical protein